LLMKKLLAKWEIKPDFANNGIEAVDALKAKDYDLILMDIHMPLMDGYEATSNIRNQVNETKANVPIIALTASIALDVQNMINQAGINDFVSKPFNPVELREKLEHIAANKTP
jgi:CheY-like chemotaxis protein